jgi:hypothetical protein
VGCETCDCFGGLGTLALFDTCELFTSFVALLTHDVLYRVEKLFIAPRWADGDEEGFDVLRAALFAQQFDERLFLDL